MCSICDAQLASPCNGVTPTTCTCGKYPWSEVAVLTQGKNSPNQPGEQNKNLLIRPIMPLAAKKKKHSIPIEITDCGVEQCRSDEFKMMINPNADNNIEEFIEDIKNSAEFLAIDG